MPHCAFTLTSELILCAFPRRERGFQAAECWMERIVTFIERGLYQESVLTRAKLKTTVFLKPRTTVGEVVVDLMNVFEKNGWVVVSLEGDSSEKLMVATKIGGEFVGEEEENIDEEEEACGEDVVEVGLRSKM